MKRKEKKIKKENLRENYFYFKMKDENLYFLKIKPSKTKLSD